MRCNRLDDTTVAPPGEIQNMHSQRICWRSATAVAQGHADGRTANTGVLGLCGHSSLMVVCYCRLKSLCIVEYSLGHGARSRSRRASSCRREPGNCSATLSLSLSLCSQQLILSHPRRSVCAVECGCAAWPLVGPKERLLPKSSLTRGKDQVTRSFAAATPETRAQNNSSATASPAHQYQQVRLYIRPKRSSLPLAHAVHMPHK